MAARFLVPLVVILSLWIYGIWLLFTAGRTQPPSFTTFKDHLAYAIRFKKLQEGSRELWEDTRYSFKKTFARDKITHKEKTQRKIRKQKEEHYRALHAQSPGTGVTAANSKHQL